MHYRLLITAQSPLVFPPRKPAAQFTPSLRYVPGSVLWGALGRLLGKTPNARFSNALPARASDQWVRLLPATALSCKNNAGFLSEGGHGAFDTLIDLVCWETLQPAAFTHNPQCPCCYERTKTFGGFYASTEMGTWRKRTVPHRLLTRVAIDRRRGTASESQLYSPIVISEVNSFKGNEGHRDEEVTTFMGEVWQLDEEEKQKLPHVRQIGARLSSGLGRVKVTIQEIEAAPQSSPILGGAADEMKVRVIAFNHAFQQRWQLYEALIPQTHPDWHPNEWRVFSIGLQSQALLLEDEWQPTMIYSAAQLQAQTGLEAILVRSQASYDVTGGWNVSWDRPKPTMLAANAGSIYLFRTQATEEEVSMALQQLEREGIGYRRQEGYGGVRGCDEFHIKATGGHIV